MRRSRGSGVDALWRIGPDCGNLRNLLETIGMGCKTGQDDRGPSARRHPLGSALVLLLSKQVRMPRVGASVSRGFSLPPRLEPRPGLVRETIYPPRVGWAGPVWALNSPEGGSVGSQTCSQTKRS